MSSKRSKLPDIDPHGDDWLMTYADMITLLLCFFAIFLSVSIPQEDRIEQAQVELQEQFAKTRPGKTRPGDTTAGTAPRGEGDQPAMSYLSSIIKHMYENEAIQIEQKDTFIQIELNSAAFFPVGSATLNPEGVKLLNGLNEVLNRPGFVNYNITVEGHTDDAPIQTPQFPSNWELSTARAASVVRQLVEEGIPARRLRAAGYADTFPKVPNRSESGAPLPFNQAQNRRVVIKLEKIERE